MREVTDFVPTEPTSALGASRNLVCRLSDMRFILGGARNWKNVQCDGQDLHSLQLYLWCSPVSLLALFSLPSRARKGARKPTDEDEQNISNVNINERKTRGFAINTLVRCYIRCSVGHATLVGKLAHTCTQTHWRTHEYERCSRRLLTLLPRDSLF